jgi:hypothetical protein
LKGDGNGPAPSQDEEEYERIRHFSRNLTPHQELQPSRHRWRPEPRRFHAARRDFDRSVRRGVGKHPSDQDRPSLILRTLKSAVLACTGFAFLRGSYDRGAREPRALGLPRIAGFSLPCRIQPVDQLHDPAHSFLSCRSLAVFLAVLPRHCLGSFL